jgi:hypothetical protein
MKVKYFAGVRERVGQPGNGRTAGQCAPWTT